MKLQDQVTNLELSRKLKKLGVEQESLFSWVREKITDKWKLQPNIEWLDFFGRPPVRLKIIDRYFAYSVAELGEMLPHFIKIKKIRYQLFISVALGEMNNPNSSRQWFVVYSNEKDYSDNAPIKFMMCYNLADSLTKMLIYLLENGLIK